MPVHDTRHVVSPGVQVGQCGIGIDVERVAGVFMVRDNVVDQNLLVFNPRKLGQVDHRVGIVLLASLRSGRSHIYSHKARDTGARVPAQP
jgi:hypothetical protein